MAKGVITRVNVEVLASVMNQSMSSIVDKMNIASDAVFINQCDKVSFEEIEHKGNKVRFFSFPDRGIGRSRNEAILRAKGDILLFSDEDIIYEDGYEQSIVEEFQRIPDADMILFNIEVMEERRTYFIEERKRVHWYNCGRYGAVCFAVRRESLLKAGVMFSLLFGGGAQYSNGEDSLFLMTFIKKGYQVYTAPILIGKEDASGESSWFRGYNDKFFYDRGVLYHYLYGKMAIVMAVRWLLSNKRKFYMDISLKRALELMIQGQHEN